MTLDANKNNTASFGIPFPPVFETPEPQNMIPKVETVNHPKHYNRDGGMECIDEMILIFGYEATIHFCLCNAWKYRYRAADKNGAEDLAKSDFYMKKSKELLQKISGQSDITITKN